MVLLLVVMLFVFHICRELAKDFVVAGTASESLYGACEAMFKPDMVRFSIQFALAFQWACQYILFDLLICTFSDMRYSVLGALDILLNHVSHM